MSVLFQKAYSFLVRCDEWCSQKISSFYLIFVIVFSSFVFSGFFFTKINGLFLSIFNFFGIPHIPLNFDSFYQDQFLPIFGVTIAVSGTLFVPPLISIYGLAKNTNYLVKLIIIRKYSHFYIARILSYYFAILISWNWWFWLVICTILLIEIFLLYRDYYEFTFDPGRRAIEQVRKILEKSNSVQINYQDALSRFFEATKQFSNSRAGIAKLKNYEGAISFESEEDVVGIDVSKLNQFYANIYKGLIQALPEEAREGLLRTKVGEGELVEDVHPFVEIEGFSESGPKKIKLLITYGGPLEGDIEALLKVHRSEFSNLFLYEKSQRIYTDLNNYFRDFYLHIVDLVKNNRNKDFKEEIKLLRSVLNEKLTAIELENIFPLLRGLFTIVRGKDIDPQVFDTGQKRDLYELWEDLFRALREHPTSASVTFATSVFIEGVAKRFWPEDDSDPLDRRITSFFSYSKTKRNFAEFYLDALCERLVNSLEDERLQRRIIDFIVYLRDDFKRNCIEESRLDLGDSCVIYKIANQRIMVLAAYAYNKGLPFKDMIYQFVDNDEFLDTLYGIYTSRYGEIKALWWEKHEFDRHGMGQMRSFNASAFYKNFALDFLKARSLSFLKDQKAGYEILSLLEDLKKELDDEQGVLKSIIDEIQKERDDDIINSDLSMEKVQNFVDECARGYADSSSNLNKFFDRRFVDDKSQDHSIGYNVALPKDLFIGDTNIIMGGLAHYGQGIARGENKKILDSLKEYQPMVDVSIEEFYRQEVEKNISRDPSILILNSSAYDHEIFDWSGQCLLNDKLFRRWEVRNEFFEMGDRKVKVLRVPSDGSDFAIFLDDLDSAEIQYYPIIFKSTGVNLNKDNLYFLFEDLAKMSERIDEIIKGSYFAKKDGLDLEGKKRHLSLRVGLQVYLNSRFTLKVDREPRELISSSYSIVSNNIKDSQGKEVKSSK